MTLVLFSGCRTEERYIKDYSQERKGNLICWTCILSAGNIL